MKRDRRLVRGSKRGVPSILNAIPKFYSRFLWIETARIYMNEVSTESAYIIDYEYSIFSLAQTRRFAEKDMKRPSHKHGSIVQTTLGHGRISAGKTPPIYLENLSVESPSSIDYKYVRFRLAQIRRSILWTAKRVCEANTGSSRIKMRRFDISDEFVPG